LWIPGPFLNSQHQSREMRFLQSSDGSGRCAGVPLSENGTSRTEEGLASEEALEPLPGKSQEDIFFLTKQAGDISETKSQQQPGGVSSEGDEDVELWDQNGSPRQMKRKREGKWKGSKELVTIQGRNMSEIPTQGKIPKEKGRKKCPVKGVSHDDDVTILKDKTRFPFFYQMARKEEAQYLGIVKLLLHFRWTWVGLLASDNDSGEKFKGTLTPLMVKNGICVAFAESISEHGVGFFAWSEERMQRLNSFLTQGQVNAFVYYGDVPSLTFLKLAEDEMNVKLHRVWITTLAFNLLYSLECIYRTLELPFHGSFSFMTQTKERMMFQHKQVCNPLTEEFQSKAFDCFYSKPILSVRGQRRCREKEGLEDRGWEVLKEHLPPRAYNVYTSIQAVAHALHAAYSSRCERTMRAGGDRREHERIQPWQFHPFLRHYQFHNTSVGGKDLGENTDQEANSDIVNVIVFDNGSILSVKVGRLERQASGERKLTIDQDAIVWPPWYKQVGKFITFYFY
ncbi:UNVERIFIED_CONTAM: hypothetical protein K2H54_062135, partial [Gekko kuhli]